jgi:putative transposase
VSQAMSLSTMKPYSLLRVCRAWLLARAPVQRRKSQTAFEPAKRGRKGFMSDEAMLGEPSTVVGLSIFVGGGHRKVWARLLHERVVRK